jgi:hypothetical protein
MKTAKDREEFCWAMGREGYPLDLCRKLMREAATYQRWATEACNRHMTTDLVERWKACEERLSKLCANVDTKLPLLKLVLQDDPRGACVKLRLPSGRGNDFGGEGLLCVPA